MLSTVRDVIDAPLNVLLVDDDDVVVMNVERAFAKADIANNIFVARDGVEALAMLRSDAVPVKRRLLLLDLSMPRMNGIELLRHIRADPLLRTVPVVVLTTSNEERDRTDAYGLNVAGYLLKPAAFADFVELMTSLNRYWRKVEFP